MQTTIRFESGCGLYTAFYDRRDEITEILMNHCNDFNHQIKNALAINDKRALDKLDLAGEILEGVYLYMQSLLHPGEFNGLELSDTVTSSTLFKKAQEYSERRTAITYNPVRPGNYFIDRYLCRDKYDIVRVDKKTFLRLLDQFSVPVIKSLLHYNESKAEEDKSIIIYLAEGLQKVFPYCTIEFPMDREGIIKRKHPDQSLSLAVQINLDQVNAFLRGAKTRHHIREAFCSIEGKIKRSFVLNEREAAFLLN